MFSETSGKNPRALAAQIGKSQLMAHSKPPPTAQPLMAPTTGLGPKTMASVARWMASTRSRASASLAGWTCSSRSSPAQKARPAPVKMMARVSGVGVGVVEGARHVVDELTVHGVQPLRPVQRHRPDAVVVEVAAARSGRANSVAITRNLVRLARMTVRIEGPQPPPVPTIDGLLAGAGGRAARHRLPPLPPTAT